MGKCSESSFNTFCINLSFGPQCGRGRGRGCLGERWAGAGGGCSHPGRGRRQGSGERVGTRSPTLMPVKFVEARSLFPSKSPWPRYAGRSLLYGGFIKIVILSHFYPNPLNIQSLFQCQVQQIPILSLVAGVQRSANGLYLVSVFVRLIYLQRAFRSQRDMKTYVIEVTDFKYDL